MTLTLIDGRSGSGKTSYARRLAAADGTRVLHMDDIYEGWHGMTIGTATLERLLTEQAAGRVARWQNWDWYADDWGPGQELRPGESLIVEGCGSVTAVTAALAGRVIWLEAPESIRHERALERDGDDSWWELWKRQEAVHLAEHDPRSLATEIVDTADC
ncbi:MAG: hypothetical protein ACTIJ7_10365 [Agrococcus casei]|uniref:hypothetical protein n=1 Tax=Agrococcus casei TaxID=343512 RepID=UPI003F9BEC67